MSRYERAEVERVTACALTFPTDEHESDATLEWDSTTCVVVQLFHAGVAGLGYTYSDPVVAALIERTFGPVVTGEDAMNLQACGDAMLRAARNLGRQGLVAHALSAVDVALWDLKARLLGLSLQTLWGQVRAGVPAYGSGGFTSYDDLRLERQLRGWRNQGLRMGKIKVGRNPGSDLHRVQVARDCLGSECELFVDANGAYTRKQALYFAHAFAERGVTWFEEPVSSDDVEGLRMVRDGAPASLQIAAGEYGYHLHDFRQLLEASAVDVLQADVTRCLGFTGIRKVADLCEAHGIPLSAHCAPALSATVGPSLPSMCHVERFHDHVGVEQVLLEGAAELRAGTLVPDADAPGHGLSLRETAKLQRQQGRGVHHATGRTQEAI